MTLENAGKIVRTQNGAMTFCVQSAEREGQVVENSRLNTLMSGSVEMLNTSEIDGKHSEYLAKLSNLPASKSQIMSQQEDAVKHYIAKINKYKRKLKKYLQKNKELQTDLEYSNQQLDRA